MILTSVFDRIKLRRIGVENVKISVVIPTHFRADRLANLLLVLGEQTLATSDFEVIVVSNLSDRHARRVVNSFSQKFEFLSYFELNKTGVNFARNHGLSVAVGEILLFLDDDCLPQKPTYLVDLIQAHECYEFATAIGGTYVPGPNAALPAIVYNQIAMCWMLDSEGSESIQGKSHLETWRLVGGNVSYKKIHLGSFQFNNEFVFGSAETELHDRLKKAGHRALVMNSLSVIHNCDVGVVSLFKKALFQGCGSRLSSMNLQTNQKTAMLMSPPERLRERRPARQRERQPKVPLRGKSGLLHRLYDAGFQIGYEYAGRYAVAPGVWSLRLLVLSIICLPAVFLRQERDLQTSLYQKFTKFNENIKLPIGLTVSGAKKMYWLGHGLYWQGYAIFSRLRSALPRVAKALFWKLHALYWRGYGMWCRSSGAVNRFSRTVFWKMHGMYWQGYGAGCRLRGAAERSGKATFWKAHGMYWQGYSVWCRVQGGISRFAKNLFWKAHGFYWRAYGWLCRIRGAPMRIGKNLFWKAHRLYWLAYGASWRLRGFYWATYTFVYWKICWASYSYVREYGWGIVRLLFFGAPDTWIGQKPKTPRFALKFFMHYLGALQQKGSKTSSFMHQTWKRTAPFSSEAMVYIPIDRGLGLKPDANQEYAFQVVWQQIQTAVRFGYRHFAFDEKIIGDGIQGAATLALGIRVFTEMAENELEATVYYSASKLTDSQRSTLVSLLGLGVKATPVFGPRDLRGSESLPDRFAIKPGVAVSELRNALGVKAQKTTILYVDLFHDNQFSPSQLYQFACELTSDSSLGAHNFHFEKIVQPMERFHKGRLVWNFGECLKAPRWSIIIPCFENTTYLKSVIDHIAGQKYEQDRVEVIVVDDGSSVPVHEHTALANLNEENTKISIKILRIDRANLEGGTYDKSFRAGVARNAGVLAATGEKILFLDSDILLPDNHLALLDLALEKADVVQSVRRMLASHASSSETRVTTIDQQKDIYQEDNYWESFKKTEDWGRLSAPWKYVCTYAFAVRRKTLLDIKLFRPEFSEYGFEDTEMGFRLFSAGYKFHLLKSPVYHLYPQAESWRVHFDEKARFETLRRTAKLFYRMHGDPSIYYELRSFFEGH